MNINWKNIAERALWTFVEGFLISLSLTSGMDGSEVKAALAAAAMAGLSAVKTLAVELIQRHNAEAALEE